MSQNTYKKSERSFSLGFRQRSLGELIHLRFLPQILFVALLCIIYIANRHRAEKKIRAIERLEVQVEDLRADYTTLKAAYMVESRHSIITRKAHALGLHSSADFPHLIRIEDKE